MGNYDNVDKKWRLTAYDRYLRFVASHVPTYKEFVLNMDDKIQDPGFSFYPNLL